MTKLKRLLPVLLVVLLLTVSFSALAQEPKEGGHLRIAMPGQSEPALLDAQFDPYWSAWLVSSLTADNLVFRNFEGKITGHLAKSWEVSDDGLTWTFEIREGVTFHDGTKLDAEAVAYNFRRVLDPDHPSQTQSELDSIESVEVVDDYTLNVNMSEPFPMFLDSLSKGILPIWSPDALEEYGQEEFSEHLVGSGPFMLEDWVPMSHVTLVKNPDYNWAPPAVDRNGPPYLDKVTLKWVKEKSVRGQIMTTGDVDVVQGLPVDFLGLYEGKPQYNTMMRTQPGTGHQYVMNTTEKSPFNDIRVRKAILHTVDQEGILEQCTHSRISRQREHRAGKSQPAGRFY